MKKLNFIKFITVDQISLSFSFIISLTIRQSPIITKYFGSISYDIRSYLISYIIASLLLIFVFSGFKLYQIREIELSARIFTVLKSIAIWTFLCTGLTYVIKFDFSRGIFFLTVALTIVFACVGRYILFRHQQNRTKKGDIEIVIIGTGDRAVNVESRVKEIYPNSQCKKLDLTDNKNINYLETHLPMDIFIADERLSRDKVLSIIVDPLLDHHSFRIILDVFKLATGEVRLNDIDEIPSIASKKEPHTVYMIIKRLIDVSVAICGLTLVSPLWILISIAIKLDSKGSVLLKQTRIGWNGQPFTIYKFRTMHENVSLYDLAPRDDDDNRITRVGKILRRFSFDEFPQLWNILKGDMSLVGPRPEMEFLVKNYAPWQRFRLKAKPGLTGLWQILGRKDIPLHENLEYDFYYVTNRSLLLDSTIILKTIPAVLFGRGAY